MAVTGQRGTASKQAATEEHAMALPHASYGVAASKQPAVKGSGIPPFVVRVQYPQLCVPVSESTLDSLLTHIRQVECARELVCEFCHIIIHVYSYRYLRFCT